MAYKAKTIDYYGVLEDVISKARLLEDPKRLLELIQKDPEAVSKILSQSGITLERIMEDLYFKKIPFPRKEEKKQSISEELLREIRAKAEEERKEELENVLNREEVAYIKKVFDRHVLTVAGVPEKEISMITETLSDEEYLVKRGIPKELAERLGSLLINPVVKAVNRLSRGEIEKIRGLLTRKAPIKEEKPKKQLPKDKLKEASKKEEEVFAGFMDYETFIDMVLPRKRLSLSILIESIGRESEVVYEIMTRLLHFSPEKVGKDLLKLRSKEEIEQYIDDALFQLNDEAVDGIMEILKSRSFIIYNILKKLRIGLRDALNIFYRKDKSHYNSFVKVLFSLYLSMIKLESLKELIFKDSIIASTLIKECGLKERELEEIIIAHDGIKDEMEKLFKDYNQDYRPFKGVEYGEIDKVIDRLKEGVEKELESDEAKVEFLYGIYNIGLNYELEGERYKFCDPIFRYCGRACANPYEICFKLGDKIDIPLPENFLSDVALSLLMALKRVHFISEERFKELLERVNEYRQKRGYYEAQKEGMPLKA